MKSSWSADFSDAIVVSWKNCKVQTEVLTDTMNSTRLGWRSSKWELVYFHINQFTCQGLSISMKLKWDNLRNSHCSRLNFQDLWLRLVLLEGDWQISEEWVFVKCRALWEMRQSLKGIWWGSLQKKQVTELLQFLWSCVPPQNKYLIWDLHKASCKKFQQLKNWRTK